MAKRRKKPKKHKINLAARRLIELAESFRRARVWRKIDDSELIFVDIEADDGVWVASVLGGAGIEDGLVLWRGRDAHAAVVEALDSDDDDLDFMAGHDALMLGYSTVRELTPEFRRVLTQAGIKLEGTRLVPLLSVREADGRLRPVRQAEIRTLTAAVAGILRCHDDGTLAPVACDVDREHIFRIRVEASGTCIEAGLIDVPAEWGRHQGGEVLALPGSLRELPRVDRCYLLAVAPLAEQIREELRPVTGLFVVDAERDRLLECRTVASAIGQDLVELLTSVFRGEGPDCEPGLPRVLVFDDRGVCDRLRASLAALGIDAMVDPGHPGHVHLRQSIATFASEAEVALLDDPKTLDDWKRVDLEVTRRYLEDCGEKNKRALKRFFGVAEMPQAAVEAFGFEAVFGSYVEWFIADYRPTVRSKTYVEKMLQRQDLTGPERVILESRQHAELSLYKVVEVDPGVSLVVEEGLSRERRKVDDRAMSAVENEGHWLFLRLFSVADWTFLGLGGPPLTPSVAAVALQTFDSAPGTDSPGILRGQSDSIGRLWIPRTEQARVRPALQNTDGEPLELLTALFVAEDPGALVEHLGARDDVEAVDDAEWSWMSDRSETLAMGPISRGRLELVGGELVVQVNSRGRLARVRQWLEQIPGVRYVRDRPVDLDEAELPLDDRSGPPPPLPPEVVRQIVPQLRRQLLGWMDAPAPMFEGLTPREACRTAGGRKMVLRAVQTMPDPTPQEEIREALDFESIRAEISRELGLDG